MNRIYILLLTALAVWNFGTTELRAQNSEWAIYPNMQHITDIAQEGDFLWVSSYGGVARLNRHTLESTLLTKANAGLPDHEVLTVDLQTDAKKWFGSRDRGLMLLDNGQWSIFTPANSPIRIPEPVVQDTDTYFRGGTDTLIRYDGQNWHIIDVSDITEGTDNIAGLYWDGFSLWAGSTTKDSSCKAVYCLNNNEWESILLPSDNKLTFISPVAHRNNVVWWTGRERRTGVNEYLSVLQYDGVTWTSFTPEDMGMESNYTYGDLTIDSSGMVWVLAKNWKQELAIARYDGITWQMLDLLATPLDSVHITCLFTDSDGVVWVGTETRELFQYKNNTWSRVKLSEIEFPSYEPSSNPSVDDYQLSNIVVDVDQSLWLTYGIRRETHVYNNTWRNDTLPTLSQTSNSFFAHVVDKSGNRWIASSNGLWHRQPDHWELIDIRCTSFYADRSNRLWVGMDGGVVLFDGSHSGIYYGLGYSSIAMTEDKNGTLWAATRRNLLTFDGNTWTAVDTQYPEELFEEHGQAKMMIADSSGLLWITGGYRSQLFSFDGTTWTNYNTSDSSDNLSSLSILAIVTDRNGNVWLGMSSSNSYTSALVRIDAHTKEWKILTPDNSTVPYGQISCLAVDTSNTLWIGMMRQNKLISYREGTISTHIDEQPAVPIQAVDVHSFPNPTAAQTIIRYTVPSSAGLVPVHIQLFNTLGVQVQTLEQSTKSPGEYILDVDTAPLASGTYYYRIHVGNNVQTQKIIVVK